MYVTAFNDPSIFGQWLLSIGSPQSELIEEEVSIFVGGVQVGTERVILPVPFVRWAWVVYRGRPSVDGPLFAVSVEVTMDRKRAILTLRTAEHTVPVLCFTKSTAPTWLSHRMRALKTNARGRKQ